MHACTCTCHRCRHELAESAGERVSTVERQSFLGRLGEKKEAERARDEWLCQNEQGTTLYNDIWRAEVGGSEGERLDLVEMGGEEEGEGEGEGERRSGVIGGGKKCC